VALALRLAFSRTASGHRANDDAATTARKLTGGMVLQDGLPVDVFW
jgi:hypothetical protein